MKVIFLDIDGVLNYDKWYFDDRNPGNLYGQEGDIDPLCVNRIIKICKETGAKVVISSDWRKFWDNTLLRLSKMGLDENFIIGKTPIHENTRGYEIDTWLSNNKECTNFVIIDDRTDFTDNQKTHFIHIDSINGIIDEHVNTAIAILNKQ